MLSLMNRQRVKFWRAWLKPCSTDSSRSSNDKSSSRRQWTQQPWPVRPVNDGTDYFSVRRCQYSSRLRRQHVQPCNAWSKTDSTDTFSAKVSQMQFVWESSAHNYDMLGRKLKAQTLSLQERLSMQVIWEDSKCDLDMLDRKACDAHYARDMIDRKLTAHILSIQELRSMQVVWEGSKCNPDILDRKLTSQTLSAQEGPRVQDIGAHPVYPLHAWSKTYSANSFQFRE